MIRLQTQFDPPTGRAASTTPSCGGCCCCCCCCLATVIGSTGYTALSLRAAVRRRDQAPDTHRRGWRSPAPELLGVFAFVLAIVPAAIVGAVSSDLAATVYVASWYILFAFAYRQAGHRRPWLGGLWRLLVIVALFVAELVAAAFLLFAEPALYLVLALALGIGTIVFFARRFRPA